MGSGALQTLNGLIDAGNYIAVRIGNRNADDPELKPQVIFDPLQVTDPNGQHLALSLAGVYATASAHHGGLTAASDGGSGYCYHLYLPLLQDLPITPEVELHQQPPGNETRSGRPVQVAIIDDEPALCETLAEVLEEMGYEAQVWHDPTEALAVIKDTPGAINIALVDVAMPIMSGIEVHRAIRDIQPDLPVILMTGYVGGPDLDSALRAPRTAFLQKPFAGEALERTIRRLDQVRT
jgi:CheY-like chemotaxis protein